MTQLTAADGASIQVDPTSGLLRSLSFADGTPLLTDSAAGLFDLALPLPDELPHRLRITAAQRVSEVRPTPDGFDLRYDSLHSDRGQFHVTCTLRLRRDSVTGGFAATLEIVNHAPVTIPQVLFPNLSGLVPTGDIADETLHLGRSVKWPYLSMRVPDGAVAFFDLYRRWYFPYGMQDWNLKWFRLGNPRRGSAVYSRDLGAAVQGLYVERHRGAERLTIAWAHYPHIGPGETWVSPQVVLLPHVGDWRVGAEPYKRHVTTSLPTVKPTKYLRGSLGVRSLYFSTYLYDNDPSYRYRDLPTVARDALAHGVREVIVWFAFDSYFELPMKLNPKLGTADELKAALAECRAMGVNVAAFISVRSLKTRATPSDWFETDEHGNRRTQAWSYSLDFVPPFNPPYCNRDESAFVCPAAAGYREAFLAGCRELNALGFSSVCFDQLFAERLCYAAGHRHKPQDLLRPLYDLVRGAHRAGQAVDPDASVSGEFFNDVSQTFQHYHWDWITGTSPLGELEAFRFIFPRFRLGVVVDRSRRWLLEGFTRGTFINFLPDDGEGLIGSDADFSALAKRLSAARAHYARFFEDGDYLGTHPVPRTDGMLSALYRREDEWLLIVSNPTDQPRRANVRPPHALISSAPPPAWLEAYGVTFFLWRTGADRWEEA